MEGKSGYICKCNEGYSLVETECFYSVEIETSAVKMAKEKKSKCFIILSFVKQHCISKYTKFVVF